MKKMGSEGGAEMTPAEGRRGEGQPPGAGKGGSNMKVKEVKGIVLPQDEKTLLVPDIPAVETLYRCEECFALYEDKDEAKECCKE